MTAPSKDNPLGLPRAVDLTDLPEIKPGPWRITKAPAAVVGILEFRGRVIVATTEGVYELKDDKLWPLEFVTLPPATEAS